MSAPGETEVAFFNGSVSENQNDGALHATDDERIRVDMMRSAARRNEKASYRLEMLVTGKPRASAPADSAASTKPKLDATGIITHPDAAARGRTPSSPAGHPA